MTSYQETMSVSPRVLHTASRFFSSDREMFGELLQNAYRAGATVVVIDTVRNSSDQMISFVFSDNGRGVDNPQKLLCLGDTGWDADEVIEPAGIGIFSTLREGIVSATYTSFTETTGWRMVLHQGHLKGMPVDIDILEPNGQHGTTVEVVFENPRNRWSLTSGTVQTEMGRLPLQVLFDGEMVSSSVRLVGAVEFSIGAYGTLYLNAYRDRRLLYGDYNLEWEWRPLKNTKVFIDVLGSVLDVDDPWEVLALQVLHDSSSWVFQINQKGGVRPNLPARTELVDNEALRSAARIILREISVYYKNRLLPLINLLPDTFSGDDIPFADTVPYLDGRSVMTQLGSEISAKASLSLLEALGWIRYSGEFVLTSEPSLHYLYDDGWGYPYDNYGYTYYSKKKHLRVGGDETLVKQLLAFRVRSETINREIPLMTYSSMEAVNQIQCTLDNLRTTERGHSRIGLASKITLSIGQDAYEVPWIITTNGDLVIAAASPEDAIKYLRVNRRPLYGFVDWILLDDRDFGFTDAVRWESTDDDANGWLSFDALYQYVVSILRRLDENADQKRIERVHNQVTNWDENEEFIREPVSRLYPGREDEELSAALVQLQNAVAEYSALIDERRKLIL